MARIRTIKPEYWSSPSMRNANPWARLLFIAMWNWADDSGRGTANVRELAAFAFPDEADEIAPTAAELPSLLAEVRGRWGVIFYEVDGRRYYAIPSWETHQRNERKAASRHPAPQEGKEFDPDPSGQGKRPTSRRFTEVPPHSDGSSVAPRGSSGPGTGEQGNRGTGEVTTFPAAGASRSGVDAQFDEFWAAYPRKIDKQDARKAWRAALKKKANPDHLIEAARAYAQQRAHEDPAKTKYPATWLNKGSYDNEPEQSALRLVSNGTPARVPTTSQRVQAALAYLDPEEH